MSEEETVIVPVKQIYMVKCRKFHLVLCKTGTLTRQSSFILITISFKSQGSVVTAAGFFTVREKEKTKRKRKSKTNNCSWGG